MKIVRLVYLTYWKIGIRMEIAICQIKSRRKACLEIGMVWSRLLLSGDGKQCKVGTHQVFILVCQCGHPHRNSRAWQGAAALLAEPAAARQAVAQACGGQAHPLALLCCAGQFDVHLESDASTGGARWILSWGLWQSIEVKDRPLVTDFSFILFQEVWRHVTLCGCRDFQCPSAPPSLWLRFSDQS